MYRHPDIEKALQIAGANMAIEGMYVTKEGDELVRRKLRGELTHEEFLKLAAEAASKGG